MRDINSFKDLDSVDDAQPVFISFVDNPSNGYGLEIEKENVYINKRAINEEKNMSDKEIKEPTGEDKLSLSGWMKIAKAFGINKSAVAEPKEQEVKTEPVKTEEPKKEATDISNNELLEKIPEAVATGITTAFEKMGEAKQKETPQAEPVKDDDEEKEEEPEKTEEVEVKTEEPTKKVPQINKQATTKEEPVGTPNTNTGFYSKAGRDEFGCRIRK